MLPLTCSTELFPHNMAAWADGKTAKCVICSTDVLTHRFA